MYLATQTRHEGAHMVKWVQQLAANIEVQVAKNTAYIRLRKRLRKKETDVRFMAADLRCSEAPKQRSLAS